MQSPVRPPARLGGDELIETMITGAGPGPTGTVPIINRLGMDIKGYGVLHEPAPVWFVILVAETLADILLDTACRLCAVLTQEVCPPQIKLTDNCKGIIPFVILQLIGLALVFPWPALATWLPSVAY